MDLRMKFCLGRYRYLNRDHPDSVFRVYGGRQAILERHLIILWSQKSYHYYVFDNIKDLKEFLLLTPVEDQRYHEVVFSEQKQRARLDIDGGDQQTFEQILQALKQLCDYRLVVCDLSDSLHFSRHVIVDHYYDNMLQAKQIAIKTAELVPANHIDFNVYHDIQNTRLTGSAKTANGARKIIITPGATLEDTLIGDYYLY